MRLDERDTLRDVVLAVQYCKLLEMLHVTGMNVTKSIHSLNCWLAVASTLSNPWESQMYFPRMRSALEESVRGDTHSEYEALIWINTRTNPPLERA
jgi:hypothetical protein